MLLSFFILCAQAFLAFLLGTILFDYCHYLFHRCYRSKNKWLKAIGTPHFSHHRFFSADLKVHREWTKKNFWHHVILEYSVQMLGISLCFFFFDKIAVLMAMTLATIIFATVCYQRGADIHHQGYEKLPSARGGFFVSRHYHALHHAHPSRFYSSYVKLLDYLLGTGHQLQGKTVAMTGAGGALGSHMKRLLEKEGAQVITFKFGVDYTYDDYEKLKSPLKKADILFLCHGSKFENAQQANCDSFVEIIELFKAVGQRKTVPLEIWATGSEIECHPCFGIQKIKVYAASKRNFARFARRYFRDRDIQYRHLVHSSFISPMGPGLMTASFAAKVTLGLIKRDFKYVPVSYTGFAWLNYLRFVFNR